jgi:hypothetical protein
MGSFDEKKTGLLCKIALLCSKEHPFKVMFVRDFKQKITQFSKFTPSHSLHYTLNMLLQEQSVQGHTEAVQ